MARMRSQKVDRFLFFPRLLMFTTIAIPRGVIFPRQENVGGNILQSVASMHFNIYRACVRLSLSFSFARRLASFMLHQTARARPQRTAVAMVLKHYFQFEIIS
jgi:hypothetical protein